MDIGIPNNFLTNVASSSTQVFSQLSGTVTLIVGILLAFLIVELIVGALHKDNQTDTI